MSTKQADGYLTSSSTGKGKPVLVLHPWWGLNETIKTFCNRLADSGYVVFAPDLYHGEVTDEIEEAEKLVTALAEADDRAKAEIMDAVQYLKKQPGVTESKIAVIAFSMGAFYALDLSCNDPDTVQAVVLFYGTGPADFSQSKASYLGHFAERDPYEPRENVDELKHDLKKAERPATFYQYDGTGHWFCESDRIDAYDEEATVLAWERTLDFLKQYFE